MRRPSETACGVNRVRTIIRGLGVHPALGLGVTMALLVSCADRSQGPDPIGDLPVDETIAAAGLPATTDVVVDELGVLHIYGPERQSVAFVQGYLTASQRFFEMDVFRRFAEGRLSELFGALTLETDVGMRTEFTTRDGRRIENALWQRTRAEDPEVSEIIESFTAGINLWLADLRAGRNGATLPPEYGFAIIGLGAADLDDWRPEDTLAIGRLQAFTLSETLGEEIALPAFLRPGRATDLRSVSVPRAGRPLQRESWKLWLVLERLQLRRWTIDAASRRSRSSRNQGGQRASWRQQRQPGRRRQSELQYDRSGDPFRRPHSGLVAR